MIAVSKPYRVINTDNKITKIYRNKCRSCNGTGGPDDCHYPDPCSICCVCRGKKYLQRTDSHQKYLCVGGPLAGQKHIVDWGVGDSPAKEYLLFNRASRWQAYRDIPKAVLVWAPEVKAVKETD